MKSFRRSTGWGLLGFFGFLGCSGASFTTLPPDGGSGGPAPDAAPPVDAEAGSPVPDSGPPSDASGTCPTGSIEFEMDVAPGASTIYCSGAGAGCAAGWLSILPPGDAGELTIDAPCLTECSVCQPMTCPGLACAAPIPVTAAGEKRTWDGTFYTSGTCGSGFTCTSPSCAPAGQYVARMCADAEQVPDAAVGACLAATTPTCVDVDFDWPPPGGQGTVIGTLGAPENNGGPDAGACCPTTWEMHSCTFPDGGAGTACHDPAQGCAASTVCGEGCDSVVIGRCQDGG